MLLLLLLLLVGFGCLEPLPCLVRKHRDISSFAKGKGVGTLLLRSSEAAMEANAPIWLSKAHPALAHLLLLLLFLPDHNLLNSFPGRQRTDSFPVEPGRRGIIWLFSISKAPRSPACVFIPGSRKLQCRS